MALAAAKIEKERVQKSVAHLNPSIDAQLFIKGVPHLTEHSIEKATWQMDKRNQQKWSVVTALFFSGLVICQR